MTNSDTVPGEGHTKGLSELLAKVQAASGPDRELDEAIWLAVVPNASRRNVMAPWPDEEPIWEYHDAERNTFFRGGLIRNYTASIDAALALVERVLPGKSYELLKEAIEAWAHDAAYRKQRADIKDMPRFVVAATLQALIEAQP